MKGKLYMFNLIPLGYFNFHNMKINFNMDNYTFKAAVRETEKGYILCAQLNGVNASDIKISYKNNYFTIAIIRRQRVASECDSYKMFQSCCGKVSRSFYLENVNLKLMKASFKNNMLLIKVPKKGDYVQVTEGIKVR